MDEDYSDRQLVCEGGCNPDLREYDRVCRRVSQEGMGPMLIQVVAELVRTLRHTPHIPDGERLVFSSTVGWCRNYFCAVCGHKRIY